MVKSNSKLIILMVAVFFLSTSAIFVKVINASAVVIAFYRLLFSGLMMLPVVFTSKSVRTELVSLTPKQCLLGFISGCLLAGHYVLWFESLNYTSVASSTVIVTLQPIFAVIAGFIFFKERVNRFGIMGILLSISGSCFIGWQDFQTSSQALYGDFLALMAAAIITAYFYIGQNMRRHIGVLSYSLVGYFSSAVMLLAYGGFQQDIFTGYSRQTWLLFICMALFSTIFGQMLINWVLKWINTTTVSVAILTEVIWASLLSVVILGEQITSRQLAGIIVIILGLLIYSYSDRIEHKRNPVLTDSSQVLKGEA